MIKKISEGILSIGNVYFIGYVGVLIYAFIQWSLEDPIALTADDFWWLKVAMIRFVVFSGIALALSLVVYSVDYLIWRFILRKQKSRLPFYFAMALFVNGFLVTVIGAIQFFIDKPYWD